MQLISENLFCKVNLHPIMGKSRSDTSTCEEMALQQNRQVEAFCSFSHETESPHPIVLHVVPQNYFIITAGMLSTAHISIAALHNSLFNRRSRSMAVNHGYFFSL